MEQQMPDMRALVQEAAAPILRQMADQTVSMVASAIQSATQDAAQRSAALMAETTEEAKTSLRQVAGGMAEAQSKASAAQLAHVQEAIRAQANQYAETMTAHLSKVVTEATAQLGRGTAEALQRIEAERVRAAAEVASLREEAEKLAAERVQLEHTRDEFQKAEAFYRTVEAAEQRRAIEEEQMAEEAKRLSAKWAQEKANFEAQKRDSQNAWDLAQRKILDGQAKFFESMTQYLEDSDSED